ncbi:MAG: hypothetical protein Q9219_004035 [cf. Caloplaca sp. 3 TL-2023]
MEPPSGPLKRDLPSSFASNPEFYEESWPRRLGRRMKEEPLIPIGIGATSWALFNASRSIRQGDSYRAQRMFRMRLYCQAFTIVAMIGGSLYYNKDRLLRKQYYDLMQEKKKQDKRDAWIRELEVRDKEEKDWRERMAKVIEKREEETRARQAKEEINKEGGPLTRAVKDLKSKIQ